MLRKLSSNFVKVIIHERFFCTEQADAKSRAWERVSPHQLIRRTKFLSELSNFILVEFLEWFDYLISLSEFANQWCVVVVGL